MFRKFRRDFLGFFAKIGRFEASDGLSALDLPGFYAPRAAAKVVLDRLPLAVDATRLRNDFNAFLLLVSQDVAAGVDVRPTLNFRQQTIPIFPKIDQFLQRLRLVFEAPLVDIYTFFLPDGYGNKSKIHCFTPKSRAQIDQQVTHVNK